MKWWGLNFSVILLLMGGAIYGRMSEPVSVVYQQPVEYVIKVGGDTVRQFYVDIVDSALGRERRIVRTFRLRRRGFGGFPFQLWVDTLLDGNDQVIRKVDTLLKFLVDETPSGSKDPTLGIGTLLRQWVGQVPNRFAEAGNTVHYLVTDVDYPARGWFSHLDQKDTVFSNKANVLFLNWRHFASAAKMAETAAHELVHLIEYRYDPQEVRFNLEGRAQMGEYICGFQWDDFVQSFVTAWPASQRGGVLDFYESSAERTRINYGRAALFYKYCLEQYGDTLLRYFVQNPLVGRAGIDSALRQVGADRSFVEMVRDFWIALWVQDINVDPRWGFRYQLKAEPWVDKGFSAYETTFDSADVAILSEYEAAYVRFDAAARIVRFLRSQDSIVVKQVIRTTPKSVVSLRVTDPSFTPVDKEAVYIVVNLGAKLYDCQVQSRGLDTARFMGTGMFWGSASGNCALLWGNTTFLGVVPKQDDNISALLYRSDLQKWKMKTLLFAGALVDTVGKFSIAPPQRVLSLGDVAAGVTGVAWIVRDHQLVQKPGWVQDSSAIFIHYADDRLQWRWQWEPWNAFPETPILLGVAQRRVWWLDFDRDTLYVGDVDARSVRKLLIQPPWTLWYNTDFHLDGDVIVWRRSYNDTVQIVLWGPQYPYTVLAWWTNTTAQPSLYDIRDHYSGWVVWQLPTQFGNPDTLVVHNYRSGIEIRIVGRPHALIHRARLFGDTLVWTEYWNPAPNERMIIVNAYDVKQQKSVKQWTVVIPVEAQWWMLPQALTSSGLWCLLRSDTTVSNNRTFATRIYQFAWDGSIRRRAEIWSWTPNDNRIQLTALESKERDVLVPLTDSSCVVELFPAKAAWDDPATVYHPALWFVPLQSVGSPAHVVEQSDKPFSKLTIQPSVNDGNFSICWSVPSQGRGIAILSVFDAQMRLLWEQHVSVDQRCIRLSFPSLASGTYICRFQYGTTTIVQPFFVRR